MSAGNKPKFLDLAGFSRSRLSLKVTRRDNEKIIGIKYRQGSEKTDPFLPLIIRTPKISAPHGAYVMQGGYNMILSLGSIHNLDNDEEIEQLRKVLDKLDHSCQKTVESIRKHDRSCKIEERQLNLPERMEYATTVSSYAAHSDDVFAVSFDANLESDRVAGICDERGKMSDVSILQGKCIVSLAIELSGIVFVTSRKLYRLEWKVLQIRKHPDISPIHSKMLQRCYLDDDNDDYDDEPDHPRSSMAIGHAPRAPVYQYAPPPPDLPSTPWTGRAAPPPPPPPSKPPGGFIAPSVNQLKDMIGKLKSAADKVAPWEKEEAQKEKVAQEIESTTAQMKRLELDSGKPTRSKKKSSRTSASSTSSKTKRTRRE